MSELLNQTIALYIALLIFATRIVFDIFMKVKDGKNGNHILELIRISRDEVKELKQDVVKELKQDVKEIKNKVERIEIKLIEIEEREKREKKEKINEKIRKNK